ncbi:MULTISPECIES: PilZ domain-containing protein [unclassified Marinobacter]|uniref:PilZ domain-containing protein n=1 Tax=unclassified Marinobacter TaxID=83889 RepID=UPI0026E213AB|nr:MULTISPECIES: PilZ domain-containing protein [unclassified Marinobacter]MDO6442434.1 PilZ domain-containing protein [Marinobacter sp. 2_MG-2023]MDO6824490.1 PilZ domain-containing protein [Marinobacter sp. 1_MG-2023]
MKDADYTFGTRDDPPDGQDNRLYYRLTARARISLELEASCPKPQGLPIASNRELACGVRDLSASGLRLLSHEKLVVGALLSASVLLDSQTEPFALIVEVIWCRSHGTDYLVGLRIIESEQTAYVEWTEAVAKVMEAP